MYGSQLYSIDTPFGMVYSFAIVKSITISFLILMVTIYALRGYISQYDFNPYSRLVIGFSWLISIFILAIWRWSFNQVLAYIRTRGRILQRILVIGTDDAGRRLYQAMAQKPTLGFLPIGCLSHTDDHLNIQGLKVLGNRYQLLQVIKTQKVDEVILAIPYMKTEAVAMLLNTCRRADVKFSLVPSLFEILTSKTEAKQIDDIPILSVKEPLQRLLNRGLKRSIDIIFSSLICVVLSPLLLFVAIAIKIESRGPMFFRQRRMGKGEQYFFMYKFRSMCEDAESRRMTVDHLNETDGPIFKIRNDPRMTKIGRWIRRFSIDELPQLVNVFSGKMSLVGPRPYPVEESEKFDSFQRRRYDVLPGITGLSQVSGRSDLSIDEIIRLDLYYIENWSLLLDLQIMIKTIPAVISRRGAY